MAMDGSLMYQYGDMPQEPFVLTGPVIGLVTDKTARVVIESSEDARIKVACVADDGSDRHDKSVHARKRRPVAVEFGGLHPETRYSIKLNVPTPGLVHSGFTTLPFDWNVAKAPARLAFVSGNNFAWHRENVVDKDDLWWDIYKKVKADKLDYLIHAGNNVYADTDDYERGTETRTLLGDPNDSRWLAALSLLEGLPATKWAAKYEKICELFRGAYREMWNVASVKHVLANVPNLMLLNDHEICDNFGANLADHDRDSAEYFVSSCAYEVYNEYQRSLFEDYEEGRVVTDATTKVHQAYHFHAFGQLGFIFLDVRAAQAFHSGASGGEGEDAKNHSLPVLGSKQWSDIEYALSDNGYLAKCRMLFIVSPEPVCLVGESKGKLKRLLNKKLKNALETSIWSSPTSTPEASYLLSLLFDWRAKSPGQRDICLIGGGSYTGANTEVIDCRYLPVEDDRVSRMKQVILPPVAANVDKMRNTILGTGSGLNNLGAHHQFKHFSKFGAFQGYAVFDVFVDMVQKHAEWGKTLRFASRTLTAKPAGVVTPKKVVNNTDKVSVPCAGGICGCGARSAALKAPRNPADVAADHSLERSYSLVDYSSIDNGKHAGSKSKSKARRHSYTTDEDSSTYAGSIEGTSSSVYSSLSGSSDTRRNYR